MKIQQIIEKHWYSRLNPWLSILLWPISQLYYLIVLIRRALFHIGIKTTTKLSIPVVIIGNISVGGAGKTPLTKHIASELTKLGYHVGIILRGYKSSTTDAKIVSQNDDSAEVGDEALIYAQAGFRVAIGAKRIAAAQLLLDKHPHTQIILADDGMQHYYLGRDYEICVIDSTRWLGNQQIIPMGPLREKVSRLESVNAIVINGNTNPKLQDKLSSQIATPIYNQKLEFIEFYNPVTDEHQSLEQLLSDPKLKFCAMAAIGNPQRFFDYLQNLGLLLAKCIAFPDHYHYHEQDIPAEYAIITTEKDYTKLAVFKKPNIWIARVSAKLNNSQLINDIVHLINKGSL